MAIPRPLNSGAKAALRLAVLTAAGISAIVAICAVLQLARCVPGIDFYQFWVVGTELRYGDARDVYSARQRNDLGRKWRERADPAVERQQTAARVRTTLQTFSSPLLYSTFAALSTGDYELDHQRYCLLCLAVSVMGILALCRVFGYSWARSLLAVTLFIGCSAPLRSDVIVTNVNQLQFGGLALYLWSQGQPEWRLRHLFGGGMLGLLLAFKPNLGLCVALLFLTWSVNGRWSKLCEHALGIVVGLASAVAASVWAFGSVDCWSRWLASMRELLVEVTSSSTMGNYSLANLIEELTGRRTSTPLLAVLGAAATAVIVRASKNTAEGDACRPLDEDVLAISLGLAAMLLGSVLVWLHYFVLIVPTAIYCLRPRDARHWIRQGGALSLVAAWIGTVLITQFPPIMGHVYAASRAMSVPMPLVKTALVGTGTILLALAVVREFQRNGNGHHDQRD
ncbi:MAG: hypothetical protein HY290_30330 [Planctomycetia bacterium]|nr:hypothetical protein [Planctomycetia bacterium]